KCHRTRCSPSELAKTYAVLSNEKKALVHEMGFGALAENVSNYNFSNLIMMELVDSFHIPDNTIRTNIGRFKVDASKVGHALGLNATREPDAQPPWLVYWKDSTLKQRIKYEFEDPA
ncbi:hypothetical protein PIB30_109260, partial [Stylosanthes scabra]|nr:hypothetical protein [Stylosanthes scabra]